MGPKTDDFLYYSLTKKMSSFPDYYFDVCSCTKNFIYLFISILKNVIFFQALSFRPTSEGGGGAKPSQPRLQAGPARTNETTARYGRVLGSWNH